MAAITSAANGFASVPATWTGGIPPGDGDTVTINHDVIVDVNATVGHSPQAGDATKAINVSSSGTLTIALGIKLIVRGDLLLNNTTMTMAAGSTYEFDASAATTPSTARYLLQIGGAHDENDAKLIVNGTSGSRCAILSNSGGANGRVYNGGLINCGNCDISYCDMTRLADSTSSWAMEFWLAKRTFPDEHGSFVLDNVIFDACGGLYDNGTNQGQGTTLSITNCRFKNSVTDENLRCGSNNAIDDTSPVLVGTRDITDNSFDKNVKCYPPTDFTFQRNVHIVTGAEVIEFTNADTAVFDDNFFATDQVNGFRLPGDASDNYYLNTDTSTGNPHFIEVGTWRSQTVDGWVFEYAGTDDNGDCTLAATPGSAVTVTIQNCLVLKNHGSGSSGTLMSALGNANFTGIVNHNTCYTGGQGLAVAETYAGHSGMFTSVQSNIFHDDVGSRGHKIFDSGADDSATGIVTTADYNCGFQLATGSDGKGYDSIGGSPGANDIDEDPQFVDSTRNIKTWDTSLGGAGTVANALAELAKLNDTDHDSNYTVANLIAYVKEGFKVQNANLKDAGHDGATIGAFEFQASDESLLLMGVG